MKLQPKRKDRRLLGLLRLALDLPPPPFSLSHAWSPLVFSTFCRWLCQSSVLAYYCHHTGALSQGFFFYKHSSSRRHRANFVVFLFVFFGLNSMDDTQLAMVSIRYFGAFWLLLIVLATKGFSQCTVKWTRCPEALWQGHIIFCVHAQSLILVQNMKRELDSYIASHNERNTRSTYNANMGSNLRSKRLRWHLFVGASHRCWIERSTVRGASYRPYLSHNHPASTLHKS